MLYLGLQNVLRRAVLVISCGCVLEQSLHAARYFYAGDSEGNSIFRGQFQLFSEIRVQITLKINLNHILLFRPFNERLMLLKAVIFCLFKSPLSRLFKGFGCEPISGSIRLRTVHHKTTTTTVIFC